jgi:hypothetical protein
MTSISVEQLLLIVGSLLVPALGSVYWLASKLSSLEVQIRSLKELREIENETLILRVNRVEKHIHEIRNTLQAMTLALIKKGVNLEDHNHNNHSL